MKLFYENKKEKNLLPCASVLLIPSITHLSGVVEHYLLRFGRSGYTLGIPCVHIQGEISRIY